MTAPSPQDTAPSDPTRKPVDWLHFTIIIVVFSITGILSVLFSRLLLKDLLDLDGDVWSGPWSYRIAYLVLIPPSYSVILVAVGTLFGKHSYFKQRVLRMWGVLLLRRIYSRSAGSKDAQH